MQGVCPNQCWSNPFIDGTSCQWDDEESQDVTGAVFLFSYVLGLCSFIYWAGSKMDNKKIQEEPQSLSEPVRQCLERAGLDPKSVPFVNKESDKVTLEDLGGAAVAIGEDRILFSPTGEKVHWLRLDNSTGPVRAIPSAESPFPTRNLLEEFMRNGSKPGEEDNG